MQAQAAEPLVQYTMSARDWWTLVITACFTILAAVGAAALTLWWQARKEKRDAKRHLFFRLMMHRKSNPPHFEWVNAVNMIDVVFADHPDVLAAWKILWDILNDPTKLGTQAHQHAQLNMLSTMAQAVGFQKLKQTDIDKFYAPQFYATQAAAQQQIQDLACSFFENINNYIASQQKLTAPPQLNQPPHKTVMPPPGWPPTKK